MGKLLNIVTPLHKKTSRDYLQRMVNNKVDCSLVAREYSEPYWDGDRKYGYGGYKYDGRWEIVARKLIEEYKLSDNASILDVGCGKAYLLYEFTKLLPKCRVTGIDISEYALENAKPEIKKKLSKLKAQDKYPFKNNQFDLVISITTLHNLYIDELKTALSQIERVGKNKYVLVESYRDVKELFNLQCWALTCESFFNNKEWVWLFNEYGYTGDYEFIYFE